MGCLSFLHPLTWGDALRPAPKIDDEKRKTRAVLFISALILVVALILSAFIYYLAHPGTKTTTVKQITVKAAESLFLKAEEGLIEQLDCKCAKPFKENFPKLADLHYAECVNEAPIYKRCIESVPVAKAAYETAGCSINACDCDVGDLFSITMCKSFVKVLAAGYNAAKTRRYSLESRDNFIEAAIEEYTELCMKNLELQMDTIETLGFGLYELRIAKDGALDNTLEPEMTNYRQVAETEYADNIYNSEGVVCPDWIENVSTGEETHPLFDNESEMSSLNMQYENMEGLVNTALAEDEASQGHYQKCAPSQCEYVEDETLTDICLKVLALASPIFSTVIAMAAVLYAIMDNHWSEREHDIVDNLGQKSSKSSIGNPIGNNDL